MERVAEEQLSGEHHAVIAGVCVGLARRWRIHPNWLRAVFAVGALASWVVAVAYLGLALLFPFDALEGSLGERLRRRVAVFDDRLRSAVDVVMTTSRRWMALRSSQDEAERGRAIAGGALLALGIYMLLRSFGLLDWLTLGRFFAIGLCLLGLALMFPRREG